MERVFPDTARSGVGDTTSPSAIEDWTFLGRNTRICMSGPCHPPEARASLCMPPADAGDTTGKAKCARWRTLFRSICTLP